MNDRIPTQIGSYEILEELGAGGVGQIYLARDARLNRDVALKVLSEPLMREPDAVDRFLREARAASALNHPNIVTVHEIGESDGLQYIVMELVKGDTLRRLLTNTPHSLDALPTIAIQIVRALGSAHEAGIVHRDIKPENIMVRSDGYVKLVDFGIARLLPTAVDSLGYGQGSTKTGIFLGTPRYMSPEQVAGEPVHGASDIFSLGVVLYEWVTGEHPFAAASVVKTMYAIMTQEPLAPTHFNPAMPEGLETLILEMLRKDPAARPNANEILRRLEERTVPSGGAARLTARRRVELPNVGRRRERAELLQILDAVTVGRSALVGVAGEPGIGKTSLIEDVLRGLSADGATWFVARGRCSERLAGTEAYLPFFEAFDSLLRGASRETVARIMKSLAPSWYAHLSAAAPTSGAAAEPKARSQELLKRELLACLVELSSLQPIALFLEDVHWADDSTVDLLAYVSSHFSDLRVAIIASYRPSELQLVGRSFLALRRDLEGKRAGHEISLEFLKRDDIREYLSLIFPRSNFPDELAALVHDKTEGNPLFMADLVRDLRDRGVIVPRGDGWVLAREISEFEQEVPPSIRSMVERKIDTLEQRDRDLLVVASVQGVRFDTAIVARSLDMDPAVLEQRLDVLERMHFFVRLVGEESLPDGTPSSQYRFVHVLYQNGLYASLRPVRRATLSGTVAGVMEAAHEKEIAPVAAELALLFDTARDFANAARYFLAAAAKAADLFADKEAVALALRSRDALSKAPRTSASLQLELEVQLTLGLSLLRTRGMSAPDVERAYSRARELCEHVGDPVRLFVVLHGLWQYYCIRGDMRRATELAEQLLGLATRTGDTQFVATALRCLGATLLHRGRLAEAVEHLARAVSLHDPEQTRRLLAVNGSDAATSALCMWALGLWLTGYPDHACDKIAEALAHARWTRHPYLLALALGLASWLHQYRRDAEAARECGDALRTLATERQFALLLAAATITRGWAVAQAGDVSDGISELRKGLGAYGRIGAEMNMPHYQALLAETLQRAERWHEAMEVVENGLAVAEKNDDRCWEADLFRQRGVLLLVLGRVVEAEESLLKAISVARQQGARMLELRCTVSLSRLLHQQGRNAEAGHALTAAYGWFREGFETVDLLEAKALLAELSPAGR